MTARLSRDLLASAFPDNPRLRAELEQLDDFLSDAEARITALLVSAEDAATRLGSIEGQENQPLNGLLTSLSLLPDEAGAIEVIEPDVVSIRPIDAADTASLLSRQAADLLYQPIGGGGGGGTTTNALSFSAAGGGAAPGSSFNGSAAITISFNSVGAAAAAHTHAIGDITGLGYFATGTDAANLTGTVAAARMPQFTGGDVTTGGAGSVNLTLANGAVTLAKQANVATATVFYRKTAGSGAPEVQTLATLKTDLGLTGTNSGDQFTAMTSSRILGRVTAGFGAAEELTGAQATALLSAFVGDSGSGGTKGLVPAPAAGDASKFLKGDGTFATPAGGADPWAYSKLAADFVTNSASAVNTGLAFTPAANKVYEFEAHILLRTATATVGPRPGIGWHTGIGDSSATIYMPTSATAESITIGNQTANMLAPVGGLPATGQSFGAKIVGLVNSGASPSGDLRIQLASETAGTNVTAKAGSFLKWREIA